MGPIDYGFGAQPVNLAQNFGQGLQVGNAINELQQRRAAEEAARQAAAQYQADTQAAMANPTPQAFAQLALRYPQHREAFKQGWEALSTEQQNNERRDAGELAAALQAGRPEVALSKLEQRITAMKNSGQPTGQLEMLRDLVKTDPKQAFGALLHTVSGIPGGDKLLENLGKVGTERRAEELQAPTVAKAKADAAKAGSDATTAAATAEFAPAVAKATAEKAAADATVAQVDAKYADDKGKLSITKLKSEIGLTNAQAASASALAKKYTAETAIAVAQAANGDPSKKFDAETKLRGEFVKGTAGALDSIEAYRRITASKADAVGDLSLIFGYMKMLDPGSVVREGEFATAQNATGVPERVLNLYNRIASGERLSPAQRASFMAQAGDLAKVAERRIDEERRRLAPVISAYKLDETNVFGTPRPPETPTPTPAAGGSAPIAVNPQTGERLTLQNGKWVPVR